MSVRELRESPVMYFQHKNPYTLFLVLFPVYWFVTVSVKVIEYLPLSYTLWQLQYIHEMKIFTHKNPYTLFLALFPVYWFVTVSVGVIEYLPLSYTLWQLHYSHEMKITCTSVPHDSVPFPPTSLYMPLLVTSASLHVAGMTTFIVPPPLWRRLCSPPSSW